MLTLVCSCVHTCVRACVFVRCEIRFVAGPPRSHADLGRTVSIDQSDMLNSGHS